MPGHKVTFGELNQMNQMSQGTKKNLFKRYATCARYLTHNPSHLFLARDKFSVLLPVFRAYVEYGRAIRELFQESFKLLDMRSGTIAEGRS